ncbi:putative ATP-dependent RNA helicase DBP6 [Aspergillus lucknowensis]|uniref:ATP-dependent RNA helicase n=1 Tax=Aspergillus lucknowensis TaxID=176173 RepID=A0ABR4M118_9EURO
MAGDRSVKRDGTLNYADTPPSEKKSHKRKRDPDGTGIALSTPTKKSKKDRNGASDPISIRERKKRSKTEPTTQKSAVSPANGNARGGEGTGVKQKREKSKTKRRTYSGDDRGSDEGPADSKAEGNERNSREKKTSKESRASKPTGSDDKNSRRAKNKFAVKEAAAAKGDGQEEARQKDINAAEPVIAKGLEPIPQPDPVLEQDVRPTYSSLPAWLADPLRASAETRAKFSELGLKPNLLRVLEDHGYKEAFAVQTAVIPLLLEGSRNHSGDLCVSAATGSGKTLSYVLPLVTELKSVAAPRLRGLIVVPTRELVKQAREACEFCSAGSGLRVGSAVGNVALKDEQRSLMRVDQIYRPEGVRSKQQTELTGDDWTDFSLQDYISRTTEFGETLPGYVHQEEPNVDILICTPGRLVDHIRYTKGFTLKHLQWLVIDEADRLLNESFQEWVDVVMGSLDARKDPGAFGFSGQFLADLGLPLQTQEPRKVILSATMTQDIQKLNSLRLTNPRLVVVGTTDHGATGEDDGGVVTRSDEKFTLPATLKEFSVAAGDGSQKPLYLLRLLSKIKIVVPPSTKPAKPPAADSEDTSSEEASSDETSSDGTSSDESTSDSGSDSDSDSNSDYDISDSSSSSGSKSDSSDSSSDSGSGSDSDTKPSTKQTPRKPTALIFTKSSESASRLSRLLILLDPSLSSLIGTIIKSNKSSASRKTLTAYRQGKLSIIIATDRASRGLDLPSLAHVVNYDVPTSLTTYVHRVGRTARAGKAGSAWTLVAHREGRWFTNEIVKGSTGKITRSAKVERVPLKLENMREIKSTYADALETLEKEVRTGGTKKVTP